MSNKQQNRTRTNGLHPQCLWMQAGVVKKKECLQGYQCPACPYDRALRRQAEQNRRKRGSQATKPRERIEHWEDRLRRLPQMSRPCVHSMKGEIEFRPCTNDYKCAFCEFEQYFDDIYIVHANLHPRELHSVQGYEVPHGYYIHSGHTWLRMEEEGIVKIGVTEFASRILGLRDVDGIYGPLVGKTLTQGEKGIKIYKNDSVAELLSPASGVVMNFNPDLQENPDLIYQKPYTDGWILRVYANNLREDLKNLMLGPQVEELIKRDMKNIFAALEEVQGPLAADGGELVDDVAKYVPDLKWDKLRQLVLKA